MIRTLNTSAHDLRDVATGSVHAIMTSPPYYGLRSYAGDQDVEWPTVTYRLNEWCEPLTVQGCEAGCSHEWVDGPERVYSGGGEKSSRLDGSRVYQQKTHYQSTQGRYCLHCGGWRGPLGLEPSPVAYIGHLILCLREWGRVLRDDGVCFVNLGDSYHNVRVSTCGQSIHGGEIRDLTNGGNRRPIEGLKGKDLLGIPWMFAFAARADGWWLRSAITWIKGNPMPESVTDRPTKATEMIFLLAKSQRYYYDSDAVRVLSDGLNRFNGGEKAVFKFGANGASPGSLAGQGGDVSLNDQWTPYLILSSLLTVKWVLVKERDNYLSQILDILQAPATRGIGWTVLASLLKMNAPSNVLGYVFEHIGIVLSEGNLQRETELRVRLRSITAAAMEGYNGSFAVEKASKVVSKIVANAQAIRDTFPLDAILECFVNVDMVHKSISLLECSDLSIGHSSDGLITETLLEEFLLIISELRSEQASTIERHNGSPLGGSSVTDYTTKAPTSANLRDWWYVNTQPYGAAHYAVWPERLVEPMIKAATSERGVCPQCGAPWRRVVERLGIRELGLNRDNRGSKTEAMQDAGVRTWDLNPTISGATPQVTTLGWQPTCTCAAGEPIPATVLDPFAGSGTTGRVAVRLGRRAILCDVSGEYLENHVPDRTTVQMEMMQL